MAYTPLPKLVSIRAPRIGCNQLSMNTFTEILQSESVKRLLNRQNVYLQTPLTDGSIVSDLASSRNSLQDKRNGSIDHKSTVKLPDLSVIPIMNLSEKGSTETNVDDIHLLPSKRDGKSEVALLPITTGIRPCGHTEPCDSIICEVEFQQFADHNNIIPLIALNIETNEIDAPVSKHCNKANCDALSIDHDRCRKAIVRCHRCDQTKTCDICLVILKTRKAQMMHKNCKMRIEYRHNRTSRVELMKHRMREREIQILETARLNKNDYMDPVTGHDKAMESLQKNSELIVIPKASPPVQQHPTIRITSVSGAAMTRNVYAGKIFGQLVPHYPVVFPTQKKLLGKRSSTESVDSQTVEKQTKLEGTTSSFESTREHAQFISISQTNNFTETVNVADLVQSQSQTRSSIPQIQSTSYFMPIRVVPIANLKTQPSLLHQSQGVPKFCLVPQTPNQMSQYPKTPVKILPAQQRARVKTELSVNRNTRKIDSSAEFVLKRFKPGLRRGRRKKNGPKRGSKSFECTFCFKRFSTDWYFKLHIAKHKGEIKFTCKHCKKPFMHLYNMQKHIVTMHKEKDSEETLDREDIKEDAQCLNCAACNLSFQTTTEMDSHPCHVTCLRCHSRVTDDDLMLHFRTKHEMSEPKALEEFERQKRQRAMVARNRGRKRHESEEDPARAIRIKEEPTDKFAEHDNGPPARKRISILSNDSRTRHGGANNQTLVKTPVRRRTRRRKQSMTDRLETTSSNKNVNGITEEGTTALALVDPISR